MSYDQRHGYRGAEAHVDLAANASVADWNSALDDYRTLSGLVPGLVTESDATSASVHLGRRRGRSARPSPRSTGRGRASMRTVAARPPKSVSAVLKRGDIVRLVARR